MRRELLLTWAQAIGLLAIAGGISRFEPSGILRDNLAGVAAVLFIWLPDRHLQRRREPWTDYGLPWWGWRDRRTWCAWGRGLVVALAASAVIFPLFFLVFWGYTSLLPHLPPGLSRLVAPYTLPRAPGLRLPDGMGTRVVIQLLVVALPEELFYRGWMQTSWATTRPGRGRRLFGATLGAGFLGTQVLFALGHLAWMPQIWRLGTFFPGLLFGWLRQKSGDIAAPVFLHAFSNLFIAILEASFYG